MDNQKSNPFKPTPKAPAKSHANFIEALKSVGSSTTRSFKDDLARGVAHDFVDSLTGHVPQSNRENSDNPETQLSPEDQINQEILRNQHHREIQSINLFDRRQEEVKIRIKVIKDELKALAEDLAGVDSSLQKAIEEEIVNPGTYHVNFFEKLRKLIIDLRKRVAESATWLEAMTERSSKQRGYWGKVASHGSKFMLSQERYMATQAG